MTSDILRTKLFVPGLPSGLIRRDRLCAQLDAGLWSSVADSRIEFARSLTLISAPAGFGKTTLAVEWLKDSGVTSAPPYGLAWLSLDEGDSDVLRFLSCLTAAIQYAVPDVRLDAAADLLKTGVRAPGGVLALLVNGVASAPRPVILVLDDYHNVHGEAVNGLVAQLLERRPPNLHLVIVSRVDPDLPLSRLRVRGQMTEARASDLRLSEEEADRFLEQAIGARLSPEWVAALGRRTEGWIAGLKLAALSMRGREDFGAFVDAFGGDHHYVVDYLVEEVLRQQPPKVQRFLLRTSVLERLCAPLCDALQGPTGLMGDDLTTLDRAGGSQQMLEKLEHANLFLIPLDEHRGWYRYHPLFADALQIQLSDSDRRVLHERAARWHLAEGYLAEAVRHALAAKSYALAGDLLAGDDGREAVLWAEGDFVRYCHWVDQLPWEIVAQRPHLGLAYARALQLAGYPRQAEAILATLAARSGEASGDGVVFGATVAMHRAHCLLESGEPEQAHALAQFAARALAGGSPHERMRARHCLGDTSYGVGDLVTALPLFDEVSATPLSRAAALNADECAARTLALHGRLRAAEDRCRAMLAGSSPGEAHSSLMAGVHATLGEIYYRQNRLELIPRVLRQAIELANRGGALSPVRAHAIWALLQFARMFQATGDRAKVEGYLRRADEIAREISNTFYLRLGELRNRAALLASERDLPGLLQVRALMPVAFRYLAEYEMWINVHAALADGDLQRAAHILDEEMESAKSQGRWQSLIEMQLWRAIVCRQLGDRAQAYALLSRALELCAPEEQIRVFLDAGPMARELLLSARMGGRLPGAEVILSAWSDEREPEVASPAAVQRSSDLADLPVLLEPLSPREIEILQLLAGGMSNSDIGHKLYIGVGTVKWYLTGIYQKLAVRSRTQAVARSRELNLLA